MYRPVGKCDKMAVPSREVDKIKESFSLIDTDKTYFFFFGF